MKNIVVQLRLLFYQSLLPSITLVYSGKLLFIWNDACLSHAHVICRHVLQRFVILSNDYITSRDWLVFSLWKELAYCAGNWSILIGHVGWPFARSYLSWPLHHCVCLYCNLFHYSDWLCVIASLFFLLLYISVCPMWDRQNWSDEVVCSVTSVSRVTVALLLQFLITSWNKPSISIRMILSHSSYSVTLATLTTVIIRSTVWIQTFPYFNIS
jgi:hypothetical protein